MKISSQRVHKFQQSIDRSLWHEAVDYDEARKIKELYEHYKGLWRRFYWPKGKSYLIQSKLSNEVYCITKQYYDSL